jgi:hypothetical protein
MRRAKKKKNKKKKKKNTENEMTKRKKNKIKSYGLRNTTKNYRFNNTNHFKKQMIN